MTSLIDEYFILTKKHRLEYPGKSILLMLVGAFYEVYGIKNESNNFDDKYSNIYDFSKLCDLAVSKKGHKYKNTDLYMAGFRDYSLEKYLTKLTQNGFRCFVYDQFDEGKKKIRKLTNIYSPGTYFQMDNKLSNNITTIWIENIKSNKTVIYGFSSVDINTGQCNIFEYESKSNETSSNELERYLSIHKPNEIILICDKNKFDNIEIINNIFNYLKNNCLNVNLIDDFENNNSITNCEKQTYIHEIFKTYYKINDFASFFETYINFPLACQSFCYLLYWIENHNPYLIKYLQEPKIETHSQNVYLGCQTLKQLNFISDNKNESVISLINNCITPMGKRDFDEILLHPVYDVEYLNEEYKIIEKILNTEDFINNTNMYLKSTNDHSRLLRLLVLKNIKPNQLFQLYNNILNAKELWNVTNKTLSKYLKKKNIKNITNSCDKIINLFKKIYKLDELENIDNQIIEKNIFQTDYCPEIDSFERTMIKTNTKLDDVMNFYNNLILKSVKKKGNYVNLHETEKMPPNLICTKKRGDVIRELVKKETQNTEYFSNLKISKITNANVSLNNDYINNLTNSYFKNNMKWKSLLSKEYILSLNNFLEIHDEIKEIGNYISLIDILRTKSFISRENNYCKPVIKNNNKNISYVNAKDIRHCLIEKIQNDEKYVTNDVCLNEEEKGMLLYGTNAVGKTSTIKALGLCLLLAQAGMYVPCSNFQYFPYSKIFTRILNNDNMFKGLSTFAIEMTEMRTILNMADERSLVLGDELCSGTEYESAISIFVSGLKWLYNNNVNFIFATHLHEIVNYDEILKMNKLKFKHLTVRYDYEKDCLIYDRKLKDGSGESVYGLEVCKSLNMPKDFLEDAFQIRKKYMDKSNILDFNLSKRYNSNIIMGYCEICKKNKATEVHHLQYQSEANEKGFIEHLHKNHKSNLISICDKCHQNIHKDNIKMEKKKTSKGIQLI